MAIQPKEQRLSILLWGIVLTCGKSHKNEQNRGFWEETAHSDCQDIDNVTALSLRDLKTFVFKDLITSQRALERQVWYEGQSAFQIQNNSLGF